MARFMLNVAAVLVFEASSEAAAKSVGDGIAAGLRAVSDATKALGGVEITLIHSDDFSAPVQRLVSALETAAEAYKQEHGEAPKLIAVSSKDVN